MKKIHKILSLLLGVLTTACFIGGCTREEADAPRAGTELERYQGTHIYTAPDTADYLVRNGACDYRIVIPENANELIVQAKDEFVCLFEKATGLRLVTVTDTGREHDANNKYISIGETTLLATSGVTVDKETLGEDGCRVVTKDKTVYICGGSDYGTQFSVYTFMQVTFDYEIYYKDCIEIETNVKNKPLKAYDVTDIPDFAHRSWKSISTTWDDLEDYDEQMFVRRLRYKSYRRYNQFGIMSPATNSIVTVAGVMNWLPTSVYDSQATAPATFHPKWYSTQGEELCYNARGDEAEREAMIDECVKIAIESMKAQPEETYPQKNLFAFLQCDNQQYCRCKTCVEEYDYYGTMAGIYIEYLNDFAAALDEELAKYTEEEKYLANGNKWWRDDVKFECYAYSYTQTAPAKYNGETGEWEALITCRDNVLIEYAPDYEYQTSFTDPLNDSARSNWDAWSVVVNGENKMYQYWYDTNYGNTTYMLDTFDFYTAETFSHMAAKSNIGIYVDSPYNEGTTTAWNNLKQYLKAKLCWDTSLDTGELINNYFNAMYKEAAPIMKNLFATQRMYWQDILIGEFDLKGGVRPNLSSMEYWPIATVTSWIEQYDVAKSAVARYLAIDPEEYENLCQHIEAEAIMSVYILLENQGTFLTVQDRTKYLDRLEYDLSWFGSTGFGFVTQTWIDGLR